MGGALRSLALVFLLFASTVSCWMMNFRSSSTHSCAFKPGSNKLYCWGSNINGQIGMINNPSTSADLTNALVTLPASITEIATIFLCRDRTCVITAASELYCFGHGFLGQATPGRFYGTIVDESAGRKMSQLPKSPVETPTASISNGRCTDTSICVTYYDGRLSCFGYGPNGETGSITATNSGAGLTPITFTGSKYILQIASGVAHYCAIFTEIATAPNGQVKCWGDSSKFQLGMPDRQGAFLQYNGRIAPTTPVYISDLNTVSLPGDMVQINAGDYHTCVVFGGGGNNNVRCWGDNSRGQLGLGHTSQLGTLTMPMIANTNQAVNVAASFRAISAGSAHTCAVTQGNRLFCWGANDFGQLGLDHTNTIGDNEPVNPAALVDSTALTFPVVGVSCGGTFTCVLFTTQGAPSTQRKVKCFGNNADNQLGTSYGYNPGSGTIGLSINSIPFLSFPDPGLSIPGSPTVFPSYQILPTYGFASAASSSCVRFYGPIDDFNGGGFTLTVTIVGQPFGPYTMNPMMGSYGYAEVRLPASIPPAAYTPTTAVGEILLNGQSTGTFFTFYKPPTVNSIFPTAIPDTGSGTTGAKITIYGSGFPTTKLTQGTMQCVFSQNNAAGPPYVGVSSVTVLNSGAVTCDTFPPIPTVNPCTSATCGGYVFLRLHSNPCKSISPAGDHVATFLPLIWYSTSSSSASPAIHAVTGKTTITLSGLNFIYQSTGPVQTYFNTVYARLTLYELNPPFVIPWSQTSGWNFAVPGKLTTLVLSVPSFAVSGKISTSYPHINIPTDRSTLSISFFSSVTGFTSGSQNILLYKPYNPQAVVPSLIPADWTSSSLTITVYGLFWAQGGPVDNVRVSASPKTATLPASTSTGYPALVVPLQNFGAGNGYPLGQYKVSVAQNLATYSDPIVFNTFNITGFLPLTVYSSFAGQKLTIFGNNFAYSPNILVRFLKPSTTTALCDYVSSTMVVCPFPAGAGQPTPVLPITSLPTDINLSFDNGASSFPVLVSSTFVPPLLVHIPPVTPLHLSTVYPRWVVDPSAGAVSYITIFGAAAGGWAYPNPFKGQGLVAFGNTLVQPHPAYSSARSSIVVKVPPDAIGSISPWYSLNGAQQFFPTRDPVRVIKAMYFTPRIGPRVGGTRVTVSGMNFPSTSFLVSPQTLGDTPLYAMPPASPPLPVMDYPQGSCRIGGLIYDATSTAAGEAIVCNIPPASTPGLTIDPDGSITIEFSPLQDVSTGPVPAAYTMAPGKFTFYTADPVVTAIAPSAARDTGGGIITLMGQNFPIVANTSVRCGFDSNQVPAIANDATSVRCEIPPGVEFAIVEASFNNGTDFTKNGLKISYVSIIEIYPKLGPLASGFPVTLIGRGFTPTAGTARCRFGPAGLVPDVPVTYINPQSVSCIVPTEFANQNPIAYDVAYSTNGIEYVIAPVSARLDLYTTPVITAITPKAGPPKGVTVTVYGTAFGTIQSNTVCRFGGVRLVPGAVPSGPVECPVPFGTGTALVEVSFNLGVAFTPPDPFFFSYYEVLSTSPSLGPRTGGTIVSVSGYGFLDTPRIQCAFYDMVSPTVSTATYVSPTMVTCPSPLLTSNLTYVLVTYDNVQGYYFTVPNNLTIFRTYNQPNITAIVPSSSPSSGTIVTIHGTGFPTIGQNPKCKFGATVTTATNNATFVTNSSLVCPAPAGFSAVQLETSFNGGADFSINSGILFTYFSISKLRPIAGPVTGGYEIEVDGDGFILGNPSGQCKFNSKQTTARTLNDLTIACFVPTSGILVGNPTVAYSPYSNVWTSDPANFIFYTPPTVTLVQPKAAPGLGGNVTVTGTNFAYYGSGQIRCLVGSTESSGYFVSISTVLCTVPPGVGRAQVKVSINGGSHFTSTFGIFDYFNVFSVLPLYGPSSGSGLQITVFGSGFQNETQLSCSFGAPGRTFATFISASLITCALQPRLDYPVDTTVEVSLDGSLFSQEGNAKFKYYTDPNVTALSPIGVPSTGGVPVTLFGTFFHLPSGPVPKCRFGREWVLATTSAVEVTVPVGNSTDDIVYSIICPALPGSMAVAVEISVNDGYYYSNNSVMLSFFNIFSIAPTSGPTVGQTQVMLTGTGFVDTPKVECRFGVVRVIATVFSSTQVQCISPENLPAEVPVEFSVDGLYATASMNMFTFFQTPEVTALNPISTPSSGKGLVTVIGNYFRNVTGALQSTRCLFGPQVQPAKAFVDMGMSAVLVGVPLVGVVCESPPGSGSVSVEVSFNNGAHFTADKILLTYFSLQKFSPVAGPVLNSFVISVVGSGFLRNPIDAGLGWCWFFVPGTNATTTPYFAKAEFVTSGSLTCTVTSNIPVGVYDFVITTNNIDKSAATSIPFTFYPVPTILDVTPNIVPALDQSYWVTISGTLFPSVAGATSFCVFDTSKGLQYQYISPFQVACRLPGLNSAVSVKLTFNDGASFHNSPVQVSHFLLISFSPDNGPSTGSIGSIVIQGSRFTDTGTKLLCNFGGVTVPAVFASTSQLSCQPPPFVSRQMIYTTRPDGSFAVQFGVTCNGFMYSYAPTSAPYIYYPVPTVSAITPTAGHTSGVIYNVTIYGDNFLPELGLKCKFGNDFEAKYVPANYTTTNMTVCAPGVHSDATVQLLLSYNLIEEHPQNVSFTYEFCRPGYFSQSLEIPCQPCAPGYFASGLASKSCTVCQDTSYANFSGSTECVSCPNNTVIAAVPRDDVMKCACQKEYYHPDGKTGEICTKCPSGGACPGSTDAPVAQAGYWADRQGSAILFLRCDTADACPGGLAGSCTEGYQGRLCAECVPGFYAFKGRCEPCSTYGPWRMALFVLFGLALPMALIKKVGKHSTTSGGIIGIIAFFFQILGMLEKLDLKLPYTFRMTLNVLTLPFTFDLNALASECAYRATYELKWMVIWALPLFFGLLFFIYYLIYSTFVTIAYRSARMRVDLRSNGENDEDAVVVDAPSSEFDVRNRVINAYILFLQLVYILPVTKSLELFDCTLRADNKISLDALPSLLCFEKWWYRLVGIAAIGIVIYLFLIPMIYFVHIKRSKKRLRDPNFVSRYGSMYIDYKASVPYWESIVMIQKDAMLIPMLFFTSYPEFQIAAFLLVMFTGLTMQLITRPYFLERYNRLQTVLRWCTSILLLLGIGMRADRTYYSTNNSYVPSQKNSLLAMLFFVLTFGLGAIQAALFFDITRIHLEIRRRVSPRTIMYINRLMHPHGRTEIIQWFAKGSLGQEYEVGLNYLLRSLALDYRRKLRDDLFFASKDAKDEESKKLLESRGEETQLDVSLDKFVDLYSGTFFFRPVIPVLRRWLLTRMANSTTDPESFAAVSLFGETFSQLTKFQMSLRKSKAYFFRPERGVDRTVADLFAALQNDPAGRKTVRTAMQMIQSLYPLDLVNESCVLGIVKQLHRNKFTTLQSLADAHASMQALLTNDRLSKASKFGATQQQASSQDDDEEGEGQSKDGEEDGWVEMDQNVLEITAKRKKKEAQGLGVSTMEIKAIPKNKNDLIPHLTTLYESTFSPLVVESVVTQLAGGERASEFILSKRSPFPYLHYLYISTRDERDEGSIRYGYLPTWVEYNPEQDQLDDFAAADVARAGEVIDDDLERGIIDVEEDSDDDKGWFHKMGKKITNAFGNSRGYEQVQSPAEAGSSKYRSDLRVRKRVLKLRPGFAMPNITKDVHNSDSSSEDSQDAITDMTENPPDDEDGDTFKVAPPSLATRLAQLLPPTLVNTAIPGVGNNKDADDDDDATAANNNNDAPTEGEDK